MSLSNRTNKSTQARVQELSKKSEDHWIYSSNEERTRLEFAAESFWFFYRHKRTLRNDKENIVSESVKSRRFSAKILRR